MIYLASFLIALIFAFLFTGYRGRGSASIVAILFCILFLAGLATPYWLVPFGPVWWGVAWLQLFVVMLFIGLLFAIPMPARPPRNRRAVDDKEETTAGVVAISIFAWLVLFMMLIAFFIGWFRQP